MNTKIKVLGNSLPKGTYALYAFPENSEWEIAFHKNRILGRRSKKLQFQGRFSRVKVKPQLISYRQENLSISFDSITHNSADLE